MSEESKLVRGKSTLYGVKEVNGKLHCATCDDELKILKRVMHVDGADSYTDVFRCLCGNSIERATERDEDDMMRWA